MDNNISISQEDLDNLTYSEFLSQFTIYPMMKEAQMKGFEAHHIVPVSIQMKNSNFTGTRREFEKSGLLDDRCIRCTPFEHILVHYLSARDLGSEYIIIFYLMICENFNKLDDCKKYTIQSLKDYALLRQQGLIKSRRFGYEPWNKGLKNVYKLGNHTEETKKLISSKLKGKKRTKEMNLANSIRNTGINNPNYGKQRSDETKEKIKNSNLSGIGFENNKKKNTESRRLIREAFLIEKNNGYNKSWNQFQKEFALKNKELNQESFL